MDSASQSAAEELQSLIEKWNWSAPEELQSVPLPRPVRLSRSGKFIVGFPILIFFAFSILFGAIYIKSLQRQKELESLQAHGQAMSGALVEKRYVGGKGAHYRIFYRYTVDNHEFRNSTYISKSYYDRLQPEAAMDVVFLPEDPHVSKLSFERTYQVPLWASFFVLLGPFGALVGAWMVLREAGKQKRLLRSGSAAPALVDKVTRRKSSYVVRYRFLDEYGKLVNGKSSTPGFAPVVGELTTILYDPQDLSCSVLYSCGIAELVTAK